MTARALDWYFSLDASRLTDEDAARAPRLWEIDTMRSMKSTDKRDRVELVLWALASAAALMYTYLI